MENVYKIHHKLLFVLNKKVYLPHYDVNFRRGFYLKQIKVETQCHPYDLHGK